MQSARGFFVAGLMACGLLLSGGCGEDDPAAASKTGSPAAAGDSEAAPAEKAKPVSPTVESPSPAETAADPGASGGKTVRWGGITATVPEGWKEEAPDNFMRAAQYALARERGDGEDASVVLTYFGINQGGSLEMNKERWAGMIQQPDGKSSKDTMKSEAFMVGDLKVITFDLEGVFVGSVDTMDPLKGKHRKSDYRLFNAVIQGRGGSHFVRVGGPKKTVDRWMPSVLKFLKSARPN